MLLHVDASAWELGLRNARAWRLDSDQPLLSNSGVAVATVAEFRARHEIPVPAGYRRLLVALGYPDTVPAGEKSRELAESRGFRSHGAIVDAVSIATLCFGGGVGLHRIDDSDDDRTVIVTRSTGSERIVPAFTTKEKAVPGGDLIYGIRSGETEFESFAWLGRRDCDAAARQLGPADRAAVLVVLGCPGDSPAHTADIGALVAEIVGTLRPDIRITPLDESDKT